MRYARSDTAFPTTWRLTVDKLEHSDEVTPSCAPDQGGEWIPIEKLSEGAEHIGGMLVRSEQMRTS